MQYVGFRTDPNPKEESPVGSRELMKQYWDLVAPGGVFSIPKIKKTDIVIIVIKGCKRYKEKHSVLSCDTLTLVYDPELKLYKLFETFNRPDSTYIAASTKHGFVGILKTIPLPLEYVKRIFKDFFEEFSFVDGLGFIYAEFTRDLIIKLTRQILTIFKLIVRIHKSKMNCKVKKGTVKKGTIKSE
jgi:hypothetical protein